MSTGVRSAGHEDLLEALGEAGDRDLVGQPELVDDLFGDPELALATIDEEQLRRIGELRRALPWLRRLVAGGEVGGQPPGQHLAHRRVVVVARHVDLEPPVLALVREAILEHDHRADVVGALEVGHVVGLDAQRSLGQPEMLLQLGQRPAARVVIAGTAQTVTVERLAGVVRDGPQQRLAIAALGHPDRDP